MIALDFSFGGDKEKLFSGERKIFDQITVPGLTFQKKRIKQCLLSFGSLTDIDTARLSTLKYQQYMHILLSPAILKDTDGIIDDWPDPVIKITL